jgi:hypothetical protein
MQIVNRTANAGKIALAIVNLMFCLSCIYPAGANQPGTVLSEGTQVTVQLAKDAYTSNMGQGDPVKFTVSNDVLSTDSSHTIVIPTGAIAMGRVVNRSKGFDHGISGKLTFTCEYVLRIDGKKVWLRGTLVRSAVQTEIQAKHSSIDIQLERGIMRRGIGYPAGSQFVVYIDQDSVL